MQVQPILAQKRTPIEIVSYNNAMSTNHSQIPQANLVAHTLNHLDSFQDVFRVMRGRHAESGTASNDRGRRKADHHNRQTFLNQPALKRQHFSDKRSLEF